MVRTIATTRIKEMECAGGCGRKLRVGSNTRNKPQCINCSLDHMRENQVQMHNRSGPYYDKWLKGMARFVERTKGGTTPSL